MLKIENSNSRLSKMNLKKATILLIAGLLYTIFRKVIYMVFPYFATHNLVQNAFSVLWLLAAISIIVFAVYFIKEVYPHVRQIQISLYCIIFFTGLLIIRKLPFGILPQSGTTGKLISDITRLLNSVAMLFFLFYLHRKIRNTYSSLKKSVKLSIWGIIPGMILGLISTGFYLNFLITGYEIDLNPELGSVTLMVFLFMYVSIINFLLKFSKVDDYSELLKDTI